jgi:hypothetical protein
MGFLFVIEKWPVVFVVLLYLPNFDRFLSSKRPFLILKTYGRSVKGNGSPLHFWPFNPFKFLLYVSHG